MKKIIYALLSTIFISLLLVGCQKDTMQSDSTSSSESGTPKSEVEQYLES